MLRTGELTAFLGAQLKRSTLLPADRAFARKSPRGGLRGSRRAIARWCGAPTRPLARWRRPPLSGPDRARTGASCARPRHLRRPTLTTPARRPTETSARRARWSSPGTARCTEHDRPGEACCRVSPTTSMLSDPCRPDPVGAGRNSSVARRGIFFACASVAPLDGADFHERNHRRGRGVDDAPAPGAGVAAAVRGRGAPPRAAAARVHSQCVLSRRIHGDCRDGPCARRSRG